MSDTYLWLKLVHVLSATVLFGTGLGTAFHMWFAHNDRDARAIAVVARNVVRADWLFTATSGVVQPVTGLALVITAGYDLTQSWLVVSYALYLLAMGCWIPVVRLQMRVRDIATEAVAAERPLPPLYERCMRRWFVLGWPAFLALVLVFVMMVVKPELW